DRALAELLSRMREATTRQDANAAMTRDVGLPLAEGIAAFVRGRFADSIALIEPIRDGAHRFGGSHAQRGILTLTLIAAALRSGDLSRARHYIAERRVHKPASEWGRRLWSRAEASRRSSVAA